MNWVAAILYAASSSTVLALALSMTWGHLTPAIAIIALWAGILAGIAGMRDAHRAATPEHPPQRWDWAAIILFTLFALRCFLWLIFWRQDSVQVLSPNNLGDCSFHITLIQQFAGGQRFWPESPIYAGAQLAYPIGADLFNSLLGSLGIDLVPGLVWVGLAGSALTGVALWKWGRGWVLAAFLCNGGFYAWNIFTTGSLADFQADAAWKSIPLALFVTQRGLLFALPAGLALLCSWRTRFFNNPVGGWLLPLWGEVLLYATLPLFHLHSFLFLSAVLGSWFLFHSAARRQLATLVGIAFLPASALVLLVTGMFHGTSVLGWKPGWMQDSQAFIPFWLMNFGVLPFFVGALCLKLVCKRTSPWSMAISAPAILVFGLCCFIKFAPWEWDNTKLMLWSYLAVMPVLWEELIAGLSPIRRAWCGCVLFGSGFLSLLGGMDNTHTGHEIASRSTLDSLQTVLERIPVDARFAAAPDYNHPLLLSGRKLAMGYEGHVWSHGYPWLARKAELATLMYGQPGWLETAYRLDIRYIYWGAAEQKAFPNSTQPWRALCPLAATGAWGDIYELPPKNQP